jgi:hypothetical protein
MQDTLDPGSFGREGPLSAGYVDDQGPAKRR